MAAPTEECKKGKMNSPKITCPCCGYKTLQEERSYEICDVCVWEDDEIQFDDPTYSGGANPDSLMEAQKNFIRKGLHGHGAEKDENWKPYD